MTSGPGASSLIDESAALWAARLVLPRAPVDADTVARLRADVADDMPAVDAAARAWTDLGADLPDTRARVLGRLGWVRTNLAAIGGVLDPLARQVPSRRRRRAAKVMGVQVGALLGLMSTKVLGQFVLPLSGPGAGELVVVGPNLVDLAREHGDLAADIRRTVLVLSLIHI